MEISKVYNPGEVEKKWYSFWEKSGYFHANHNSGKKPYVIVIPPPNITGILTVGHVLNNTIQDILIRWKKMQGYETLWLPGTDHAGIATQNAVEKKLASEGLRRQDLGREKFIEKVWEWVREYKDKILIQLRRLGCACDWERERFTFDEGLSNAVVEVFIRLYKKGLIYRGKYIVNWCPRCETALSDEQVEHFEKNANMYYIKYPLKSEEGYVTVATTRPETMLGDTAIAVNPKDERYKSLVGKIAILPLVGRELPIIADEYIESDFGTGILKVTPAHDPNDYWIGKRHNLPFVNVLKSDGTMNDSAGKYAGMERFECRRKIIEDLKDKFLDRVVPYSHSIGQCERCETIVEPYLSDQWFVRMKPLAEPAIRAVEEGEIRFHPERWIKVYRHWIDNVRDWCVSRQLWWGHRIPIYYCKNGKCKKEIVSKSPPVVCPECGGEEFIQDEDVLDTWFSSWLWPFSTLGWPENSPELEYFYPTDTLSTAPDIIFLWVARMIIAGIEFVGKKPFSDVYFHAIIRDEKGRRMSKSLGNSPDPLELMDKYGTDALRFTVVSLAPIGQDIRFAPHMVELGRNFANKIWNASRFVFMNAGKLKDINYEIIEEELEFEDRWILSRYNRTVRSINENLERFQFNGAAKILYDFIWHDYCDWYIEMSKIKLSKELSKEKTLRILLYILEGSLRLLHPFMPFLTEEIWQNFCNEGESIMKASYPEYRVSFLNDTIEWEMNVLQDVVTSIRNIRTEFKVTESKEVSVWLRTENEEAEKVIQTNEDSLITLTKLKKIDWLKKDESSPPASASAILRECEVYIPLEGIINVVAERARLEKEKTRLKKKVEELERKLSSEEFLRKAPSEIVEIERLKEKNLNERISKIQTLLHKL